MQIKQFPAIISIFVTYTQGTFLYFIQFRTMSISGIKRKFERTLSEGRGMQLLWLILIIVALLMVFWAIASFLFDGSTSFKDLINLFLGADLLENSNNYAFHLVIVLCGMFLFSAFLISVVSNMFENIAEDFRTGQSRYKHHDHILILGAGNSVKGILSALCEKDDNCDIVVMTSRDVEELRKELFTFFDGEKRQSLEKRLTLYFGERDNENNLAEKDLAKNARIIYIIGEDDEIDHDSISVRSGEKLQRLCHNSGKRIQCYLVLNDSTSMDVYKYSKTKESLLETDLRIDIIDANEHLAEQVLVSDHDNKDIIYYPRIDYRDIQKSTDGNGGIGNFKMISGILEDTTRYVHFVVVGMSNIGRAMALTAAHICHFPNYHNGKYRTKITFIDSDIRQHMDDFIGSYENLFQLSHYSYLTENEFGEMHIESHTPDKVYGDFIDIEWEFINSHISAPSVRRLLETWVDDQEQSLSLCVCFDNQVQGAFTSLHLPVCVYNAGIPVFVYQKEYGEIIEKSKSTGHFGNIFAFGMAANTIDDPLYEYRAEIGKRVNFVYDQHISDSEYRHSSIQDAWDSLIEAHKFSSIYCGNSIYTRMRSFNFESQLSAEKMSKIYEVEHRRWMVSDLILGYYPETISAREEWLRILSTNPSEGKLQYKAKKNNFIHLDIMPFQDLPLEEKNKDKVIVDNFNYILSGTGLVINKELMY